MLALFATPGTVAPKVTSKLTILIFPSNPRFFGSSDVPRFPGRLIRLPFSSSLVFPASWKAHHSPPRGCLAGYPRKKQKRQKNKSPEEKEREEKERVGAEGLEPSPWPIQCIQRHTLLSTVNRCFGCTTPQQSRIGFPGRLTPGDGCWVPWLN